MENKIKIGFQETIYKNDVKLHFENKEILYSATNEYSRLMGAMPLMKDFLKGFVSYTIEQIKGKHIEATRLGLSDEKLISLYGYDLNKLEALETSYNFTLTKEPNETNYFVYAESEQELQRFKKCEALINAWNDLQKDFESTLKPNLYVHYKNNQLGQPLQANISFIKGY